MRKLIVVVLFLNLFSIVKSQNLTVEGTPPDLYLTHTVAPKENFYSIARLYNQPPKIIASYNKITMEKGLNIGQKVKIPLNAQNFDVSDNANSGETLIPITHIVAKSETLFKIAGNNETANLIRKWNHLTSDNITPGTPLVIGHLKVNGSQPSVSFAKNNESIAPESNTSTVSKPAMSTEAKQPAAEAKKEDTSDSVNSASSHGQKSTEDSNAAAGNTTSQEATESSPGTTSKDTAFAVIPEEPNQAGDMNAMPAKEKPSEKKESVVKNTEDNKKARQPSNETTNSAEGAFAKLFEVASSQKSLTTKSGQAATFKSTSGWQDKKYYVLMSDVTPGTILKISSSTENKVVYAKVLGSMPEMKENDGLLLRISNAAASDLGIIDPKFPIQISYYQ